MQIIRTNADAGDFKILAAELELELKIRDGENHEELALLNTIANLPFVVIAYIDNEPIGCGGLYPYYENEMELKRMFVRPSYRGKNIAIAVLKELERWCVELNKNSIVLETGINQPEAIAFYKKNEYTIIPNFGKYINNENSVCFRKEL